MEEPDVIGFLESDFSISLSGKKLFKKDVYYDKYSGEKILFLEYQWLIFKISFTCSYI